MERIVYLEKEFVVLSKKNSDLLLRFKDREHKKDSTNRLPNKCKSESDKVIYQLLAYNRVYSDDMSFKIIGIRHWLWTRQNDDFKYLLTSENRLSSIIKKLLTEVFTQLSIMLHDYYTSHFNVKSKIHQLCLDHPFRELYYLIEIRNSDRTYQFKKALWKAIKIYRNENSQSISNAIDTIKQENNNYIEAPLEQEKGADLLNFRKRMFQYKDYLLSFLDYSEGQSDNIGSERSMQNFKVNFKIASQLKTKEGANSFATIGSIIDTVLKQKVDPLQNLLSVT